MHCCFCQQEQMNGYYIKDLFLCEKCEEAVVSSTVDDPEYPRFVAKMKYLWQSIALGELSQSAKREEN